jgi:hypothetical protein
MEHSLVAEEAGDGDPAAAVQELPFPGMLLEVFSIGSGPRKAQAVDAFAYASADLAPDGANAGPPEPNPGQRPLEKEDTVAISHDPDVLCEQKNDRLMILTTDEHR